MAAEPIEGKVASIVNATELTINRGTKAGVREGMKFGILDPATETVVDPDTQRVLGRLWRPKVVVQIISVDEEFALAKTYFTERVNLGGSALAGLTRMFEPQRWMEKRETFTAPDTGWQEITESESVVKVGDIARQITRHLENDPDESAVLLDGSERDNAIPRVTGAEKSDEDV